MSDNDPARARPGRRMFQISLRAWWVLVTVVAALVGWQSRRAVLTPGNVASLGEVAALVFLTSDTPKPDAKVASVRSGVVARVLERLA